MTIKALLRHGGNVNAETGAGVTPMSTACMNIDVKAVHRILFRLFTENGADVNYTNKYGFNALMIARLQNKTEAEEALLEHGAKLTAKQEKLLKLFSILENREEYESVHFMMKNNWDPNVRSYDGMPILFLASGEGLDKIVKYLLYRKVDVEARNAEGVTVLEFCAEHSLTGPVRLLLESGRKISQRQKNSALLCAGKKQDFEIVKLLLEHGANANSRDEEGKTVLMHVAPGSVVPGRDFGRWLKLLFKHNADINACDNKGKTALYYSYLELIDMASTNPTTFSKNSGFFRQLIRAGADINMKYEKGDTLLMEVCRNRYYWIPMNLKDIQFFLRLKPDVNIENDNGLTALDILQRSHRRFLSCQGVSWGDFLSCQRTTGDKDYIKAIELLRKAGARSGSHRKRVRE